MSSASGDLYPWLFWKARQCYRTFRAEGEKYREQTLPNVLKDWIENMRSPDPPSGLESDYAAQIAGAALIDVARRLERALEEERFDEVRSLFEQFSRVAPGEALELLSHPHYARSRLRDVLTPQSLRYVLQLTPERGTDIGLHMEAEQTLSSLRQQAIRLSSQLSARPPVREGSRSSPRRL